MMTAPATVAVVAADAENCLNFLCGGFLGIVRITLDTYRGLASQTHTISNAVHIRLNIFFKILLQYTMLTFWTITISRSSTCSPRMRTTANDEKYVTNHDQDTHLVTPLYC